MAIRSSLKGITPSPSVVASRIPEPQVRRVTSTLMAITPCPNSAQCKLAQAEASARKRYRRTFRLLELSIVYRKGAFNPIYAHPNQNVSPLGPDLRPKPVRRRFCHESERQELPRYSRF